MTTLTVKGMSCGHCVKAITNAIKALDPQAKVDVDLAGGLVHATSNQTPNALADAINELDYLAAPL